MYDKPFYIDKPLWNNLFSFNKRENKKLYITSLKTISDLDEIKLWYKVVFEDFDFDNKLITAKWLEFFYHIKWKGKDIIFFDNHNHAIYFWYEARNKKIIGNDNILIHIDEHSDMREPSEYIPKKDFLDLEKVFYYTNYVLNVWNYIIPALKEGLIKEVMQIRNQLNLEDYFKEIDKYSKNDIILNLDLDFFEPGLDYIDYELKKKVVLDAAKKATFITVASSPFFIDQKLALEIFRDLFS